MYPRFLTLQTGSGFACYKEIPCTITRPAEVCFALCLGYLTCTLAFPAGFLDLRVEGAGTLAIITGLCHPDFLGIVAVRACCVGMLIRHVSLRFCMTVQKKGLLTPVGRQETRLEAGSARAPWRANPQYTIYTARNKQQYLFVYHVCVPRHHKDLDRRV